VQDQVGERELPDATTDSGGHIHAPDVHRQPTKELYRGPLGSSHAANGTRSL
jgi:hypothetical protein